MCLVCFLLSIFSRVRWPPSSLRSQPMHASCFAWHETRTLALSRHHFAFPSMSLVFKHIHTCMFFLIHCHPPDVQHPIRSLDGDPLSSSVHALFSLPLPAPSHSFPLLFHRPMPSAAEDAPPHPPPTRCTPPNGVHLPRTGCICIADGASVASDDDGRAHLSTCA